jgi:hypothetical protein
MLNFTRRFVGLLALLNIAISAILLLLLGWTLIDPSRFLGFLGREFAGGDPEGILLAMRLVLMLTVPVAIAAHLIFRRLSLLLDTVRAGDPFVAIIGRRLREIAYAMLVIQLCDLLFGAAGTLADAAAGERLFGWSPGLTGWVAVLLAFVLARVFQDGAKMRDDLRLTV